jgi:hypothetical protein
VLKRQQKFGTVKARSLFVETLLSLQMVEELSSIDKAGKLCQNHIARVKDECSRKHEVELLLRLETEFKRDDKWVIHPSEN